MAVGESERYALMDALAEDFAARYRRGERPTIAEYIERHPDLATDIRELLPALVEVERVKVDLGVTMEDAPAAAPPLDQIGDFRIIREVGKGGMGVVYEAEQVSLARRVALKLLPKKMLLDRKAKQRFEREAKAAAKLHHTNIVPVFGVGEHDGLPYFVMQFIQGLGLDAVLAELRRIRGVFGSASASLAEQRICPTPQNAAAGAARSLMTGKFQPCVSATESSSTVIPSLLGSHGGAPNAEGSQSASSPPAPVAMKGDERQEVTHPRSGAGPISGGLARREDDRDAARSSSSVILPGQSGSGGRAQPRATTYWQSVARIGVQVADALDYAHNQGILHRDVKPSNLLLDDHGTVWVTDFGLAKVDDQPNLTDTGDILGTLRYMPPEAFDGHTDARSDVYALGLTLYELLAFRPAFDETDRPKLIKQLGTTEPCRLRKLNRQVPRDLETIVHKAMDREPVRRYATAEDLAADLQRFLNDEPIRARRLSSAECMLRWSRRNKGVAAMTALAAALLLTIAVVSGLDAWRLQGERDAVLEQQRRANVAEAKAVAARTEALFTAAPDSVPFILESLKDHQATVLPELRSRRGQWKPPSIEDLRLTIALAVLGEDQLAVLCERVAQTAAPESGNAMLGLLACERDRAIAELQRRYQEANPGEGRTRLSIALLTLGDPRAAQAELAVAQNPTDRVRFVHVFSDWHGSLAGIPDLLRSTPDPEFRSGMCLAAGSVGADRITPANRKGLDEVLEHLYTTAADGGTHGAAAWALAQLRAHDADRSAALHRGRVAMPKIAATQGPSSKVQWFINRQGMTMIGLRPGSFQPESYLKANEAARYRPLVVLTRPYFMLDQEVTAAWYQSFLDSDDHPQGEELTRFPRSVNVSRSTARVDWIGAVLYCNWLSRREGRLPCYRFAANEPDAGSAVSCNFDANGYRLPTDAEWEYAFRCGSTSLYVTGDDVSRMLDYGRLFASAGGRGKEFLPNPWGLFDLLGNGWEITWNMPEHQPTIDIDPVETVGRAYALRGGSAEAGLHYLPASYRFRASLGDAHCFRVVCGPLDQGMASDKGAAILAALENNVGPPPLTALLLRAQWHAEAGQWRAAIGDLEQAIVRWPRDNLVGLQAAALNLAAGDREGYRQLRRALLQRFKTSTAADDLERTAKACTLLLGTAEEMRLCVEMAERAPRLVPEHVHKEYFALAAGFALYRAGDAEAALARLNDTSGEAWNWVVPADLLRVMIFHRQQKLAAARDALAHACRRMESTVPRIADAGEAWHDVLVCRILRREAEALLAQAPLP
jgi:serine/threonine protein kinase/formylglycine-generating enzyme required for sulfatase activity